MDRSLKLKLAAGAAGGLAAAGAGGAIAATQMSSPGAESQAIVKDAARQLGVTQLAAAVEAGRLTKTEDTRMLAGIRQRISSFVHGRRPVLHSRPGFPGGAPPPGAWH